MLRHLHINQEFEFLSPSLPPPQQHNLPALNIGQVPPFFSVGHTNQLQCLSLCSHLPLHSLHTTVAFGLVACCLPEIFSSSHFSAGSRLFSVFCTARFVSDHVFSICPHLWGQQTCESARIFASHHRCVFRHINFSDAWVYSHFPINQFPSSWHW